MRELSEVEIDRIIEMAWEDRTPFEAISYQFQLNEGEVIALMRRHLSQRNWKKWRARVQGRSTKHQSMAHSTQQRFKCTRQRSISGNRISKRKF